MKTVTIKKVPKNMYFALGGEPPIVSPGQLYPLQTEKGELVIHPDFSVTKSAARLPHSMMKNEITDTLSAQQTDEQGNVIAPGAYVASNDKRMAIPKSLAKEVDLGIAPAYYSEDMHLPEAKMMNFGDSYFTRNKMTPADLTKSVLKKLPKAARDEEQDIFAMESNKKNKAARIMPLDIIKGLNEYMKKGEETAPQQMMHGGKVKKYRPGGYVTKAEEGLGVEYDAFIKAEIDRLKREREAGIPAGVGLIPQSLNAMAGLTGAAFTAAQNPISKIYQPDAALLRETARPISNAVIESTFDNAQATQNQGIKNAAETGQISQKDIPALYSENALVNSKNQAILGNIGRNADLRRGYAKSVIGYQDRQVEGENKNIEFLNRHLSNLGNVASDTLGNAGNILAGTETYRQAKNANINENINALMQSKVGLDIFNSMRDKKTKEELNSTGEASLNSHGLTPSKYPDLSSFLAKELGVKDYQLPLDKAKKVKSMYPPTDEGNSGYAEGNPFDPNKRIIPGGDPGASFTDEDGAYQTEKDGIITRTHENGLVEIQYEDGSTETKELDGTIIKRDANGNIVTGAATSVAPSATSVNPTTPEQSIPSQPRVSSEVSPSLPSREINPVESINQRGLAAPPIIVNPANSSSSIPSVSPNTSTKPSVVPKKPTDNPGVTQENNEKGDLVTKYDRTGVTTIESSDGKIIRIDANGTRTTQYPDGTITQVDQVGNVSIYDKASGKFVPQNTKE